MNSARINSRYYGDVRDKIHVKGEKKLTVT